MNAPGKTQLCATAVAACAAFGAAASPAFAGGLTLHLVPPHRAVVGKPTIMHARGFIPARDRGFPYYFSLDAIPPSVMKRCPADRWAAVQIAQASGGANLVNVQREVPNGSGHFDIPIALRPSAPGAVRLCGYTDDGALSTLARDGFVLHIKRHAAGGKRARRCHRLHSRKARARCLRRA